MVKVKTEGVLVIAGLFFVALGVLISKAFHIVALVFIVAAGLTAWGSHR